MTPFAFCFWNICRQKKTRLHTCIKYIITGLNKASIYTFLHYWIADFFTWARAFATAGMEMTMMVITASASKKL